MEEKLKSLVTVLLVTGLNNKQDKRKIMIIFRKPTLNAEPINTAFESLYSCKGWTGPGIPPGDNYDLLAVSEARVSMLHTDDPAKLEIALASQFHDAYKICY